MTKITIGIISAFTIFVTVIFLLIFKAPRDLEVFIEPTPSAKASPIDESDNKTSVYVTYYGWSDNDPPGTAIAYPKGDDQPTFHTKAEGIGTYQDPVTFAGDPKLFPPGTIIYVPYIKKYAIMEDWCAGCIGKQHIDIWAGGDGTNQEDLITCEENATRESEQIILSPDSDFETDTTPIFDAKTSKCLF